MVCGNCGSDNREGRKFCSKCGTALAMMCPSCGAPNDPDDLFCGECGASVSPHDATTSVPRALPASERRLVSVLFADLVGFTTLSERRDAEEVRELLSRYFDSCRQLIVRYGGTVEKFIGDAVMAVWGAPVAQEDDAERAVRAALDLTDAVEALGQEVGAPDLRARAGVLTGEAAVTLGASAEGMVAGDLVNTASRIQSAASPGEVFVGETTRRVTEAAIAYEDAGEHELKGKAEPVRLHRALRVVARVGGGGRSEGLEAPFAGRDRELRLIKDLFHASAEERKAQMVSVVGVAGIGKSRLSWEFYKYIDGLATTFRWHRGRCLSYGEGVTYWALAEMVRTRAGIVEGEEAGTALPKLRQALEDSVADAGERRFLEPRLAHLLGLEERMSHDRDDLFAAWRLFYERLAEQTPTIMVFEDMQWADAALLDFVEYLLEWSRSYPMFILTLARPDLTERRPSWGTGRAATSMYLEPLPEEAMRELLGGLVPGLPDEIGDRILQRAQGVPLYAVETVRMLLDRGLLAREETGYRPTGPIDSLEVPDTLHALIAARLDGLSAEERRLVQDAAVLGKTFTKQAIAAVSALAQERLDPLLASLVRKEVLSIQADPLSPERGQYGFLQDLVRHVAYETLSRKERRERHLVAAEYLERAWGSEEEEIVEVVASHFVEAYRAAPDAPDADEIRTRAREMLTRAGERAASLAAAQEAQRYYEQAADLAGDPSTRATLLESAGQMAWLRGSGDAATPHLEAAIELFESTGNTHAAARVTARLGEVEWVMGHNESAIDRMERAFEVLAQDTPDEAMAQLAAQLARFHYFRGDVEVAGERVEQALGIAEALWLPEVLAEGLNTKAVISVFRQRLEESYALLSHALRIATEHGLASSALRTHINLGETLARRDRYEEALQIHLDGVALARRTGARGYENVLLAESTYPLFMLGRWDEALEQVAGIPEDQYGPLSLLSILFALGEISAHRGDLERAAALQSMYSRFATSPDLQDRSGYLSARSVFLAATGHHEEALAIGEEAIRSMHHIGVGGQAVKGAMEPAVSSALALGRRDKAEELLDLVESVPIGQQGPLIGAQVTRLRARLAGGRDPEALYKRAAGTFRELGVPFWLAVTLLEHGEWLAGQGRREEADPFLDEAAEVFGRLQAGPWLDRAGALEPDRVAAGGPER